MAEDGTLSGDSVGGLSADDIVPNVYEGGFKTWECSMDLSSYICSNIDVCGGSSVKDTTIIEVQVTWKRNPTQVLQQHR